MSDDISIPGSVLSGSGAARTSFTHSYRSRRAGMDSGTKRLLLAAGALGTLLVVGMGVWTFTGHRAVGVPTIQADTRPLRVKPENPGGMTIGVGEQSLVATDGPGDLAPAAEQPDPQALLAQRRAAAPPKIAEAAPAPAATPTAPAPVAPAPAAPAAQAPAARVAEPVAGKTMVQLAALDSEAAANAEWQRLSRKLPDLLGDRKLALQKTEQSGKVFWRVRTGGFADVADAATFCKKIKAKGVGCSLANF